MNEKASAIWSKYILDGTRMDSSPGNILNTTCRKKQAPPPGEIKFAAIIDETLDPPPSSNKFDKSKIEEYLRLTAVSKKKHKDFSPEYPEFMTKSIIAYALISSIWKRGSFCLKDLALSASWKWNTEPLGNMSAFYNSVEAACDYLGELGVAMKDFSFSDDPSCSLSMSATLDDKIYDLEEAPESFSPLCQTEQTAEPHLGETRKCGKTISGDESSWIIYIPFDTCNFKLGASLLSEVTGNPGGKSPDLTDTEYFADCFEVVRELVEDGIVKAGSTVGRGGLMTALGEMLSERSGLSADISGLMSSYAENDVVNILFGEVPGVIIEITDADYDYIDAEFLLQDIAYYPLGHPSANKAGLQITMSDLSDISSIMNSLISRRYIEGYE